jgi:hypothetical protein
LSSVIGRSIQVIEIQDIERRIKRLEDARDQQVVLAKKLGDGRLDERR